MSDFATPWTAACQSSLSITNSWSPPKPSKYLVIIHSGSFYSEAVSVQFSSVTCRVQLFETPWTAARHSSLSITNSQSLLKLKSTELVMPSNHLIFCRPLLLLPSIFPSIRVFSNESALRIRWPKYWSFSSTSVLPMNTQDWFPLEWTGLCSLRDSQESYPTPQFKSINSSVLSFLYSPTIISIYDYWKNHSYD